MNEGRSAGAETREGEAATLTVHVAGVDYTAHPDAGPVTIGRELPAQIRIDEPGISRMHVRLEPAGDHWVLTDTGSRNGTFFDRRRVDSLAIDRELDVYLGNPDGICVRLRPSLGAGAGAVVAPAATDTFAPDVTATGTDDAEPDPEEESTEAITPTVQVAVAIDAADIALRGIYARTAMLPMSDDPQFAPEAAALLSELRRLETSLTNAARSATGRPELAIALGEVRQAYTDLMRRAARAPAATLGQRLYEARHRCQLTVQETANAAGVTDDDVINAESDLVVPGPAAATLQRFVDILEHGWEPR
ncbi:FHA domain-containing protein [Mycobacterium sp. IS-3022]|uniref:FHA domain-containing protein n=1 Tax=Mycobacterium sp. IS-3022 TaxID=1772277 RepID=UPI0007416374|nr:FHA domain-containing protein [Mycobacterium sp. IS-3022]KUH94421.1 hypothetical protein AU188_12890 [Mycobacterium sp. IS-3022]